MLIASAFGETLVNNFTEISPFSISFGFKIRLPAYAAGWQLVMHLKNYDYSYKD
jgi:type III secretory pathway component EscR